MRFVVISDTHFENAEILSSKPIAAFVRAVQSNVTIDFAVCTGDLTDNGFDGQTSCSCLGSLIGTNNILVGGSKTNELKAFIDTVVKPIDATGKHLYLIQGNHDRYNGGSRYPVADFIRKRHGALFYSVVREGVRLLFCDVYPTAAICTWISTFATTMPTIFFFHYNLTGDFSEWWTDAEKQHFFNTIKEFTVLGIFVGHQHTSGTDVWNTIPVYLTAGDKFGIATVTNSGVAKLNVTFSS